MKCECYLRALVWFQDLARSVKLKVPDITKYVKIAEQKKSAIDKQSQESKYLSVFDIIQRAFKPKATLIIGHIKDPMLLDVETQTVILRRDQVKELYRLWKRKGLLPLFFEISEPLARVQSLEQELDLHKQPTGRVFPNKVKQLQFIYEMGENLCQFAQTEDAPKRLLRRLRDLVPVVRTNGIKKPPTHVFGKRDTVLGGYLKGSSGGRMIELLVDEEWHEKDEIAKAVAPRDLNGRLKSLEKRAAKYGLWTVEKAGSKIRIQLVADEGRVGAKREAQ